MKNPVNRKEMLLQAIAEGKVCDLEPLSREEMYLLEYAKREANEGNGSGGGTPNAVQYTAQELTEEQQMQARANLGLYRKEMVTLFPESQLEGENGEFSVPGFIPVAGNTYDVTYNGTAYSCTAVEITRDGISVVAIGNTAMVGGEDTGEPFVIAYAAAAGGTSCIPLDGSAKVTLEISSGSIYKIAPEYLPEGIGYMEMVELLPEKQLAVSGDAAALPLIAFVEGQTYTVTWNGNVYECTAFSGTMSGMATPYVFIGDASSVLEGASATGEPFYAYYSPIGEYTHAVPLDGSESPTMRITTEEHHRIDAAYMPEELANLAKSAVEIEKKYYIPLAGTTTSTLKTSETVENITAKVKEGYTIGAKATSGLLASFIFYPLRQTGTDHQGYSFEFLLQRLTKMYIVSVSADPVEGTYTVTTKNISFPALTINGTTFDGSAAVDFTDVINAMIDAKLAAL